MTRVEELEVELWPGAGSGRAWRLSSDDLRIVVAEHGAHIINVELRSADTWVPISVDYATSGDPGRWHGATVGRWANRIEDASFQLDGQRYVLEANDGANCLHGGSHGFGARRWRGRPIEAGVELSMVSPDGDQGFPGELSVGCTVELDANAYRLAYTATTDAPTVVNLTTHVYWNLAGGGGLDGHRLVVNADSVIDVDEQRLPVAGLPAAVEATRFDCRNGRRIESIITHGGYDNCFVADRLRLEHSSGRSVELTTDQPGIQIYTGDHLEAGRRGIAFEPQRIPNAPNRPDLGEAVLRPGQTYRSESTFSFGTTR